MWRGRGVGGDCALLRAAALRLPPAAAARRARLPQPRRLRPGGRGADWTTPD